MKNCSKKMTAIRLGVLGLCLLLGGLAVFFQPLVTQVSGPAKTWETVVIDPGHGGFDGGCIGVNGVYEKDINLSIAKVFNQLCMFMGYDTIMTRYTDTALCSGEITGSLRQQKVEDINNRLAILERQKNAVCVCIHQNKFTDSEQHGAQMFYGILDPASEGLAKSMQSAFTSLLQPDNTREIKRGDSSVYLLTQSPIPIVLSECGFLSNEEECEKLSGADYQAQVAFTLLTGLVNWQSGVES